MTVTASRAGLAEKAHVRPSYPLLYLAVFVGGVASIGVEIAASRLIAPYFGNSTFIWATIIGLTLTYLSVGYYLGGKLADRYPSERLLYLIFAGAAIGVAIIPIASRPILNASLDAFADLNVGAFFGTLVGVIFLFLTPIALLGGLSPRAIRLRLQGMEQAGGPAGSLCAPSPLGPMAGSFLPVLVLIPYF